MKYTDIQLTDKELWAQFQSLYQSGNYASALAFLQNTQLNNKALTADILNALTDCIVQVEQLNDPNFKADKIQLSRRPPAGMTSGQVYFRWLAPYLFNEVDALGYTFNEVDNFNITWAQVDEGGW